MSLEPLELALANVEAQEQLVDRSAYEAFLASKVKLAEGSGLPCEPWEVNPLLKPHQRDTVCWAVRGGRRAVFASFGLGKTFMQLEIIRLVLQKAARGPAEAGHSGLITCPLGVRQEFARDALTLATGEHPAITAEQRAELKVWQAAAPGRVMPVPTFIRSAEEMTGDGIYL